MKNSLSYSAIPLCVAGCLLVSLAASSADPATPATPATPAEPGGPGNPATPAVPAIPAKPGNPPMTTPVKFKGKNNGWGNGDQDAPGNSGSHNNAENSDRNPPPGIANKSSTSGDEVETASYEALQEELSQIESSASTADSYPVRRVK